jgi:hypothetical protein
MNIQFQMTDVKVRLAVAILYKASVDSWKYPSQDVPTDFDGRQTFWENVSNFWEQNFSHFSSEKIMEIYKIAKRAGFKCKASGSKKTVDAKYVINSTKYFHSSGVYEYELKTAEDWKRNTKVARIAGVIGLAFLGIQMPMDA